MTKDRPNSITAAELREQTALGFVSSKVQSCTFLEPCADDKPLRMPAEWRHRHAGRARHFGLHLNTANQAGAGTTIRLRKPLTDIYQENPDD